MFQSQRELLAGKHQAAELDPLSIGEEKIFRNGANLGTSSEYGLCIQRLERGPWKIDGALEDFCSNKSALLYNHAQKVKQNKEFVSYNFVRKVIHKRCFTQSLF